MTFLADWDKPKIDGDLQALKDFFPSTSSQDAAIKQVRLSSWMITDNWQQKGTVSVGKQAVEKSCSAYKLRWNEKFILHFSQGRARIYPDFLTWTWQPQGWLWSTKQQPKAASTRGPSLTAVSDVNLSCCFSNGPLYVVPNQRRPQRVASLTDTYVTEVTEVRHRSQPSEGPGHWKKQVCQELTRWS